jgi:serine/threonine-protein kinase
MDETPPHNGNLFDNRYRLGRRLGSGGMADVYLATDELLGRQVAIKILSDRFARDDGFVERFRREASAAAGLNHPNIVAVYDRGEAEGTYYIAMEFLDGPTLKQEITQRAPLPEAEAIGWATQALDALDFAHRRGVIHRDVKPHNMVLTDDNRLKVTDFGIARAQNTQEMTEVGSIVGTAQYLSPEQARGQAVGPQSDLYSMGIVLFEMLTGELPFTGDGAVDIAMKQVSDQPPSLRSKNRLVSPELEQVVMRALAKDPALRHSSARAMADELRRVSRGGAVSADTQQATQVISAQQAAATAVLPPAPPPTPAGPKRSLLPWLLVVLFLVVAAGIGLVVYQQLRGDQVTVPRNLKNRTCAAAQASLQQANLTGKCVDAKSTHKQGLVFKVDPDQGSSVDKNSTITLSISAGPGAKAVPNVSGKSAADATAALNDAGFKNVQISPTQPNTPAQPGGDVVSTSPKSGTVVDVNKPITLSIASGLVKVPTVAGLNCNQARKRLQSQKLNGSCTRTNTTDTPVNEVIGTAPSQDSLVSQGTPVTINVSDGPGNGVVPAVLGLSEADASTAITNNGFKVAVINTNTCTQSQDDTVTGQDPTSGQQAPQGSAVHIRVAHYNQSGNCPTPPVT